MAVHSQLLAQPVTSRLQGPPVAWPQTFPQLHWRTEASLWFSEALGVGESRVLWAWLAGSVHLCLSLSTQSP